MSVIPEGFRYEPQWFSRVIPKLFQIELSGLINLPQGTLMPPQWFFSDFCRIFTINFVPVRT